MNDETVEVLVKMYQLKPIRCNTVKSCGLVGVSVIGGDVVLGVGFKVSGAQVRPRVSQSLSAPSGCRCRTHILQYHLCLTTAMCLVY